MPTDPISTHAAADTAADATISTNQARVILAPMVRGSELSFRNLVRQAGGVKQCYSPMLRSEEVCRAYQLFRETGNSECATHEDGILLLTDIMRDPEPLVVQLCGSSPHVLSQAVQALLKVTPHLQGVDLNLGCPQSCAEEGCFGAFLVEENPDLAVHCVQAMKQTLTEWGQQQQHDHTATSSQQNQHPRLSCKIRLQDTIEQSISLAQKLIRAGCELLAVHCRRRADKNCGKPDWNAGKALVEALSIPVVINRGIMTLDDVEAALKITGAHGVMLASGLLANPRLLIESHPDPAFLAASYLDFVSRSPPPSSLFIRRHLRWIFRAVLEPADRGNVDYDDWRPRLWTFLVRPYLETLDQFRQVVALYVKLNGSSLPGSLGLISDPSFKSIRNARRKPASQPFDCPAKRNK